MDIDTLIATHQALLAEAEQKEGELWVQVQKIEQALMQPRSDWTLAYQAVAREREKCAVLRTLKADLG